MWGVLSLVGYTTPPRYVGQQYEERGVPRCCVHLTLLPHLAHPEWPTLEVETLGYCLDDTWEATALQGLTTFYSQHPEEVAISPVGLFPSPQADDPMWLDRMDHMDLHFSTVHECTIPSAGSLGQGNSPVV